MTLHVQHIPHADLSLLILLISGRFPRGLSACAKAALKKSNTTVQAKRKGTNKTFLVRKKKCNQKQSGKATTHPGDQAVTEAHTSLAAADDTQLLAPWSTPGMGC